MIRILTEPKNAIIKQYQELFRMDGIKLSFSDNSLEEIVEKTLNLGLGARGLRTIVEEVLSNYMFESSNLTKEIAISTIF
jgi:ATP-dependent Clp protease ATP-binding subunit ClpX